jgi:hypothetical protein
MNWFLLQLAILSVVAGLSLYYLLAAARAKQPLCSNFKRCYYTLFVLLNVSFILILISVATLYDGINNFFSYTLWGVGLWSLVAVDAYIYTRRRCFVDKNNNLNSRINK